MGTFSFTPPVDCDTVKPTPPGGQQKTRTVAGVTLTQTALGYDAQGVTLEVVEDASTYWSTTLATGEVVDGRTLEALVKLLVRRGVLTKDTTR